MDAHSKPGRFIDALSLLLGSQLFEECHVVNQLVLLFVELDEPLLLHFLEVTLDHGKVVVDHESLEAGNWDDSLSTKQAVQVSALLADHAVQSLLALDHLLAKTGQES